MPLFAGSTIGELTLPKLGSSFIAFGVVGSKTRGAGVAGEPFGEAIVCIDDPLKVGQESVNSPPPTIVNGVGALKMLISISSKSTGCLLATCI